MQVNINGVTTEVADATTVTSLVAAHGGAHRGVAVALNGDVVPRGAWPTTQLAAGDSVEVLSAAAGG